MGMNFLAVMLGGALSDVTQTTLYGRFTDSGHPESVWYALVLYSIIGILVLMLFTRMADTAAHLVDQVLPKVPVRQWVITLPFALRYSDLLIGIQDFM